MQTVNLIQGSPEWHAHRRNHFNASDAPAMMGVSPYKTRDQLLHEMATGITKEVDAGTQKRFDDGHRFEALARPLAEKIIGEELSPTVGVDGKYSASFDGITFGDDITFEQPNYVALKVAEEQGEVIKAAVHFAEGRDTAEHVRDEMVQLIAMLYRLWVEGDQVNGVPAIGLSLGVENANLS